MAQPNVRIVKQEADGKTKTLRVVNPHWNKALSRKHSTKGGGHKAVRAALQSIAKRSMVTKVKYQPSNGCWYFQAVAE